MKRHKQTAKFCLKIQQKEPGEIFKCEYCSYESTRKSNLTQHLKTCEERKKHIEEENINLRAETKILYRELDKKEIKQSQDVKQDEEEIRARLINFTLDVRNRLRKNIFSSLKLSDLKQGQKGLAKVLYPFVKDYYHIPNGKDWKNFLLKIDDKIKIDHMLKYLTSTIKKPSVKKLKMFLDEIENSNDDSRKLTKKEMKSCEEIKNIERDNSILVKELANLYRSDNHELEYNSDDYDSDFYDEKETKEESVIHTNRQEQEVIKKSNILSDHFSNVKIENIFDGLTERIIQDRFCDENLEIMLFEVIKYIVDETFTVKYFDKKGEETSTELLYFVDKTARSEDYRFYYMKAFNEQCYNINIFISRYNYVCDKINDIMDCVNIKKFSKDNKEEIFDNLENILFNRQKA